MLKSRFRLPGSDAGEGEVEEYDVQGETIEGGEMGEVAGEAVVEEEKIVYAERKVRKADITSGLSMLGLIAEGDGYAYLKVSLNGLNLTDLSLLKTYKNLLFVDVSNNYLELEALQALAELPYLVLIHADNNVLQSAALKRMKYLQVIIMNYNKISSVSDVYQPELSTLEVGYNTIQHIAFTNRMPQLKVLDFRYNLIHDISNIDFPNLDSLYLAGNKIVSLVGIETLKNLRILHVRNNPIKLLNGFDESLSKLQYINLRNCKVSSLIQVKKLRVLKALDTLVMKGCPYMGGTGEEGADAAQEEEDAEVRVEILAALPRLKRINKTSITPEERTEANELMKQWIEEGENDEEEVDEENNEEESKVED